MFRYLEVVINKIYNKFHHSASGPVKMIRIITCSHLDFQKGERLRKLLKYYRPPLIGIETEAEEYHDSEKIAAALSDSQRLEFVCEKVQKMYQDANPQTIRMLMSTLFDDTIAVSSYVSEARIPLIFCDSVEESFLPQRYIKRMVQDKESKAVTEMAKILRLSPNEYLDSIAQEYSEPSYPVADNPSLVEFYSNRDQFTEALLVKQEQDILYICYLDHIYGDYHPNLWDRLQDLNPVRMKLNEADSL